MYTPLLRAFYLAAPRAPLEWPPSSSAAADAAGVDEADGEVAGQAESVRPAQDESLSQEAEDEHQQRPDETQQQQQQQQKQQQQKQQQAVAQEQPGAAAERLQEAGERDGPPIVSAQQSVRQGLMQTATGDDTSAAPAVNADESTPASNGVPAADGSSSRALPEARAETKAGAKAEAKAAPQQQQSTQSVSRGQPRGQSRDTSADDILATAEVISGAASKGVEAAGAPVAPAKPNDGATDGAAGGGTLAGRKVNGEWEWSTPQKVAPPERPELRPRQRASQVSLPPAVINHAVCALLILIR